jgi:hypothetical protein
MHFFFIFANKILAKIKNESHKNKELREFNPHHNRIFVSPGIWCGEDCGRDAG